MINMDDPTHQQQRKPRVAPLQPGRRARPGGPRARARHRDPRPRRAARRVRGGRGDRVAAAGDDDRRPARLPARHVGAAAALVGADHDARRAEHDRRPAVRVAPRRRPGHGRLLRRQTAELVEARRAEPRDDLISVWVAQGWEPMHVLEETLLAARRRRRDDAHRHRLDDPRARAPTRPAPAAGRAPRAALDHRGRGVHPLGVADPQHAPHRHRGARAARADVPRGRPGGAHVRGGRTATRARSPTPTVST